MYLGSTTQQLQSHQLEAHLNELFIFPVTEKYFSTEKSPSPGIDGHLSRAWPTYCPTSAGTGSSLSAILKDKWLQIMNGGIINHLYILQTGGNIVYTAQSYKTGKSLSNVFSCSAAPYIQCYSPGPVGRYLQKCDHTGSCQQSWMLIKKENHPATAHRQSKPTYKSTQMQANINK